jgi:hypothetical protein
MGGAFNVRDINCVVMGGEFIKCEVSGVIIQTHGDGLTQLTLGFSDKDYIITYEEEK